ncbi:MAG: GNAT family N-acetyltransferase [Oscillospiraceae bacterium]|nr:GNAT family N-acetyltransferase [Oscillospiraceae bacterium]
MVLKNIFDFDIENAVLMYCKNRIDMPKIDFEVRDRYNFNDAYSVMESAYGKKEPSAAEFWKLRMTRGVQKGQTTLLTLHDGAAVSTACIRGRTENAGVITSVITSPDHRHKGYASYLTALCSNILFDEHRTPWLVPANPGVQKMYEKLGFVAAKNYYYLYNIKEKEDRK